MKPTWESDGYPTPKKIGPFGWLLVAVRGPALALALTLGVIVKITIRMVEIPFFGINRPVSPYVTQITCKAGLLILGIRRRIIGSNMTDPGAFVANHVSWIDILTLNSSVRMYFVSKSEVEGWPLFGWLAKLTGTVFINRMPKEARKQKSIFENRLAAGHKLLFFPEGTSTDGIRVLTFKSTLFAAFFNQKLREKISIQPVSVVYHAPFGEDSRFYGWWGNMGLGEHMLRMLAQPRHGHVKIVFHQPLKISDYLDRKALAAAAEQAVRSGMPSECSGTD
ncbi:MAG: lysophospholipid acyltransferase family protein [Roseovarius sp.]|nr:lysophospholipid acyltransferase family protein [Roseovarius sp.]MCY4292872.1 lysophospholipid acyltransferase family protein [Roseovarius sp.]